jgi:FMN-dependent NADH-azoreductase
LEDFMPTLLVLESSPLASSVSRELTREFVSNWKTTHPSGQVIHRDLAANPPKPVDQAWIFSAYTPADALQPEQKSLLAPSDEYIDELEKADEYVVGVAMHNFSIPSVLKLWIDQIVRVGRTFTYGADGAQGKLSGKKDTILAATGGVYDQGTPYAGMNFIDPYLKTILGFVGVSDIKFVTASGTSQLRAGKDRGEFLKPHLDQVRSIAV